MDRTRHCWATTRRRITAVVAVAFLAAGFPAAAEQSAASEGKPQPVPGGSAPPEVVGFNFWLPERGLEPSMVGDFDGVVAIAEIHGTGVAVEAGREIPMTFSADMRIMTGTYVDTEGNVRRGSFGFL